MKCMICKEAEGRLVVYHREKNTKAGYLVVDEDVEFNTDKIAKFLYYCEQKGIKTKSRGVLDICHDCLRGARVLMQQQ